MGLCLPLTLITNNGRMLESLKLAIKKRTLYNCCRFLFPDRLTAGRMTLDHSIVVRIHVREFFIFNLFVVFL